MALFISWPWQFSATGLATRLISCKCAFVQISDLQADNEEYQRNIQQLKKKAQRATAELQDTKLHLEGQQSRNHDLEKKQRKSVHTHTYCHIYVCRFT